MKQTRSLVSRGRLTLQNLQRVFRASLSQGKCSWVSLHGLHLTLSGPSSLREIIWRNTSGVKKNGNESEIESSVHRVSVNQTQPLVLVTRHWDSIERMSSFLKAPHS